MRLKQDIQDLKQMFKLLCQKVEENMLAAFNAAEFNPTRYTTVKQADQVINTLEIDIEEMCLSILAKHQPLARDLRYIIAVLKINNSLERIGDLSVKFSKRHKYISNDLSRGFIIPEMIDKVIEIFRSSIKAFVEIDKDLAMNVIKMDEDINELKRKMKILVIEESKKDNSDSESLINLLINSRNLERIADLSTNIAEELVFYCDGVIIRHTA